MLDDLNGKKPTNCCDCDLKEKLGSQRSDERMVPLRTCFCPQLSRMPSKRKIWKICFSNRTFHPYNQHFTALVLQNILLQLHRRSWNLFFNNILKSMSCTKAESTTGATRVSFQHIDDCRIQYVHRNTFLRWNLHVHCWWHEDLIWFSMLQCQFHVHTTFVWCFVFAFCNKTQLSPRARSSKNSTCWVW